MNSSNIQAGRNEWMKEERLRIGADILVCLYFFFCKVIKSLFSYGYIFVKHHLKVFYI